MLEYVVFAILAALTVGVSGFLAVMAACRWHSRRQRHRRIRDDFLAVTEDLRALLARIDPPAGMVVRWVTQDGLRVIVSHQDGCIDVATSHLVVRTDGSETAVGTAYRITGTRVLCAALPKESAPIPFQPAPDWMVVRLRRSLQAVL